MSELRPGHLSILLPIGRPVVEAGVAHLGVEAYRETRPFAGVALNLTSTPMSIGLRAAARLISVPGYRVDPELRLIAGWTALISRRVRLEAQLSPLVRTSGSGTNAEGRETVAGLTFAPTRSASVYAALRQSFRHPLSAGLRVSLQPNGPVRFTTGLTTAPLTLMGGVSIALHRGRAHLYGAHHGWLGWTRGIAFSFLGPNR